METRRQRKFKARLREAKPMKEFFDHSSKFFTDGLTCPYCKNAARWCSNEERYGRRYGQSYMCYWCKDCDAYVGCHQNSKKPLGSMANAELRKLRILAHAVIDPLWRSGKMDRRQMYRMLSEKLGRTVHIGWSDEKDCKEIIEKFSHGKNI